MAFPNVIYGDYGDQFTTSTTRINNLPLGHEMILPDGRKFRLARANSSTALGPAQLLTQVGQATGHGNIAASALTISTMVVGASTITVTARSTVFTVDQYKDGFMLIADDAGEGHVYKIKSNPSAAVSTSVVFTLEDGETVQVAVTAADVSTVRLSKSPYDGVLLMTSASVHAGQVAGIPAKSIAVDEYFWVQRHGEASVFVGGTATVESEKFVASTGIAGSAAPIVAGSALATLMETEPLGRVIIAGSVAEQALVYLELE